jgi:hypothetical protein
LLALLWVPLWVPLSASRRTDGEDENSRELAIRINKADGEADGEAWEVGEAGYWDGLVVGGLVGEVGEVWEVGEVGEWKGGWKGLTTMTMASIASTSTPAPSSSARRVVGARLARSSGLLG